MDVGLALPQYDYSVAGERPLSWATVVAWARWAEELGFSSVWLSDHLFLSLDHWGGEPGRHEGLDPLVGLTALARLTASVRVGTLVLCTPLRPPGVLAKALATVDVLSGGRLVVGMGAGWYEPELRAAGIGLERPAVRLQRLEEAVVILRGAFGGGPFSFTGRTYQVQGLRSLPLPRQRPAPPIWIGGRGDRLLAVAARCADGWNALGWTGSLDSYRRLAGRLDEACERAERDPSEVARSVNRAVLVGEDEADLRRRWEHLGECTPAGVLAGTSLDDYRRGRLVGTVEQVREQVSEWAAAGVSTLIVNLGALPFVVTGPDDLELVSSAVT